MCAEAPGARGGAGTGTQDRLVSKLLLSFPLPTLAAGPSGPWLAFINGFCWNGGAPVYVLPVAVFTLQWQG